MFLLMIPTLIGIFGYQINEMIDTRFAAALTAGTANNAVGAAEKTLVAALTASQIDGVVAKMIYNDDNASATAGVGGRIKVAGTAITAANIKAEYDKIYAAIPAEV